MARAWIWSSILTLLLASACVGSKPRQSIAGPSEASQAEAPGDPAVGRGGSGSLAGAPASARRSAQQGGHRAEERRAGRDDEAPNWRRPGLATSWGEQRDSRVSEVSFARDGVQPFGLVAIRYDDERGIHAATGRDMEFAHAGVFPIAGGALSVSVVDAGGEPLPGFVASGRGYVIGDQGDRYMIRIINHTPGRFEAVTTVDGLDVIDGQDGSTSKRGYIVAPWGTLDIEGFREGWDAVRAFRFGSVEDSYAVARGKGQNIGVIGVALFAERGWHFSHHDESRRRSEADPFPGRFAPPPSVE